MTPRTEALWADPAPRTPEGRRLWDYVGGVRDIGQRICQTENEAIAARNAELAEKVRGLPSVPTYWPEPQRGDHDYGLGTPSVVYRAAVLALIEEVASPNREPGAL